MESTASLLELIRDGDDAARERLLRRMVPMLQRWATGRLPAAARDLVDTDDLVQNTLVRSLRHLPAFESRHEGALLVYLRRAVLNQIRDHVRRTRRQPESAPLSDEHASPQLSPLERVIRAEMLERYERALEKLTAAQREAVVLRLEMGYAYAQLAEALGLPSPDAARMLVTRGLVTLAAEMNDGEGS